ncbi:MAG: glucokinase [Bryobacterales bacterium]|nr:glucokinase [Bryobacterales bacterium]
MVEQDGRVLASVVVPTLAAEGYEVSIAQLYTAIDQLMRKEISAIGICSPGPLNPKTGVVINPPNLPGWRDVPLAQLVEERYKMRCQVENDANAAGLAEALLGAGRGFANVFYTTLSTGVGAGIIINGKIYHGKNGAAAEGGHVTIDYRSEAVCNCGSRGCIEALASGTAMTRRALGLIRDFPASLLAAKPVTAETIGCAAAADDPLGVQILDETAEMLGAWLGSMISLLDPDVIVIGGGVAQIGEPLFSRLRRITPARTINQFASETPIVPAQLGSDAGIIGAAAAVDGI